MTLAASMTDIELIRSRQVAPSILAADFSPGSAHRSPR